MAKIAPVFEGKAKICLGKNVFYNPHMRFNRDISSLAVGAIGKIEEVFGDKSENEGRKSGGKKGAAGKKSARRIALRNLEVLDAFCATGIRGSRYKTENENVGKVTFLDANKGIRKLIGKNIKVNKIAGAKVVISDFSKYTYENSFDFVEVDPFGSPSPFIYDAIRSFKFKKSGVLSVTATDTAVLCGARHDACIKNYNSIPLNNEFCHENAIRILLSFIARNASQFNFGIAPLVCFSKRHYVKCIVRLEFGADKAVESAKNANHFVQYCHKCLERKIVRINGIEKKCPECGNELQAAGPLWAGKTLDRDFVKKMIGLNAKRKLEGFGEIAKFLVVLESEADMPAFYYDLHRMFKVKGLASVPNERVVASLQHAGFTATLTHFSPTAIKTGAPAVEVEKAIKKANAPT